MDGARCLSGSVISRLGAFGGFCLSGGLGEIFGDAFGGVFGGGGGFFGSEGGFGGELCGFFRRSERGSSCRRVILWEIALLGSFARAFCHVYIIALMLNNKQDLLVKTGKIC